MDHAAPTIRPRRTSRLLIVGVALAVAIAATGIGLFTWANTYQPLSLGGGGANSGVRIIDNSTSMDINRVALIRPGHSEHMYIVRSQGRWPVTIDGVEVVSRPDGPRITARIAPWRKPFGAPYTAGPHPKARLAYHGQELQLNVAFDADCGGMRPHTYMPVPKLAIHYRYLRVFSRSQVVAPSDVLTMACP